MANTILLAKRLKRLREHDLKRWEVCDQRQMRETSLSALEFLGYTYTKTSLIWVKSLEFNSQLGISRIQTVKPWKTRVSLPFFVLCGRLVQFPYPHVLH